MKVEYHPKTSLFLRDVPHVTAQERKALKILIGKGLTSNEGAYRVGRTVYHIYPCDGGFIYRREMNKTNDFGTLITESIHRKVIL
jgi:hypothetical protein